MMMLPNLGGFSCRALSAFCFLAASTFTAHTQPLTFTTFAGSTGGPGAVDGTGAVARFTFPVAVTLDSSGNVYVADSGNSTVRKITPAGVVTTLAGFAGFRGGADGTGSDARFGNFSDGPVSVAADANGNIYVADYINSTIRKITPAGVVTTFAGLTLQRGNVDGTGSAARFDSPSGVAIDSNGNLYVADSRNNNLRKVTPAGVVTTIAGSGSGNVANFNAPSGVAVDSGGNIYVADTDNHTIRKITSAGVVTTLAGSAGLSGSADGTGGAARFHYPEGVAIDSVGNIYVADAGNDTIRKITPAGAVTTLAGAAEVYGSADGNGGAARFNNPVGLAIDSGGNVYVADASNNTIRKISPAGVVTTLAGAASPYGSIDGIGTAARFSSPQGVAADASGNVYVADTFNETIRRITPAGVVTTLAGSIGVDGTADGTGSAARFDHPEGVATDAGGNVYVADTNNHTIRKVSPAGVVTTLAGSADLYGSTDGTGSAARFLYAVGVATDSSGNVYVADTYNETIRKITSAGVVTTLAGSPGLSGSDDGTGSAARFSRPLSVAPDSSGNIFVSPGSHFSIRKVTQAGVVTSVPADAFGPTAVATDSSGNVYLVDLFGTSIKKITPGGVITNVGGSLISSGTEDGTGSAAHFYSPQAASGDELYDGVAVDGFGNVYVADSFNNKVRVGRPALSDVAVIDVSTGAVGTTRQLGTSPQTATSWQWTLIRRPSNSSAQLSSTSIRNPVFTPDVADVYIFQLTASDGVKTSITTVRLTAKPGPRNRAIHH